MTEEPLNGRPLAQAAHAICQELDPSGAGLSVHEIEAALVQRGVHIFGERPRATLGNSLKNHQDLFTPAPAGKWAWTRATYDPAKGLSGAALAEEAYRILAKHDSDRNGMHYEKIKELLLKDGVAIRGGNRGNTLFTALNDAKHWFEWASGGMFRLKR